VFQLILIVIKFWVAQDLRGGNEHEMGKSHSVCIWNTDTNILKDPTATFFREKDECDRFSHTVGADVASQGIAPNGLV
jgi:hypothetical protein